MVKRFVIEISDKDLRQIKRILKAKYGVEDELADTLAIYHALQVAEIYNNEDFNLAQKFKVVEDDT